MRIGCALYTDYKASRLHNVCSCMKIHGFTTGKPSYADGQRPLAQPKCCRRSPVGIALVGAPGKAVGIPMCRRFYHGRRHSSTVGVFYLRTRRCDGVGATPTARPSAQSRHASNAGSSVVLELTDGQAIGTTSDTW